MISIYNETKTPWRISELTGKKDVLLIGKSRDYQSRKDENVRVRKVGLIAYRSAFDNKPTEELQKLFNEAVNTTDLCAISEGSDTGVAFNRKHMAPYITGNTTRLKDVFLISIDLRGRRIVSMSNNNVFLLEGYIHGGEFCLIASLNNPSDTIQVKLMDIAKNTAVIYAFGKSDAGKLYVEKNPVEITGEDKKASFSLRKFRPLRATHAIVTASAFMDKLKGVVDTEQHNILTFEGEDIASAIEQLKSERYSAVTLAWDGSDKNTQKNRNSVLDKLQEQFTLVNELMVTTGKVTKIKAQA